jgi:phosphomannomutase
MARLSAAPPERVAGDAVRDVERVDGLRFALADGFVMLRVSGTEPLLRVYAEARDRQSLARRLSAGRALLSVDGVAAAD